MSISFKNRPFFLIILYLFLSLHLLDSSFASGIKPVKFNGSLDVKNETLHKVLKRISIVSGYKIELVGDRNFTLSVKMENVSLHSALKRILRNINHVIIWNEEDKEIKIVIYDPKNPNVSITGITKRFEQASRTTSY